MPKQLTTHDEIEAKLEAGKVSYGSFAQYVHQNYEVFKFEAVSGLDDYYLNGANVVRHRKGRGEYFQEITVKRRKSELSTRNREEIDIKCSSATQEHDVAAFLQAIGFSHAVTLFKEAHIFWVHLTPTLDATFVIYDIHEPGKSNTSKRFIEVEIAKDARISQDAAIKHITQCVTKLRKRFKLGKSLNSSIWEIYSGLKSASI